MLRQKGLHFAVAGVAMLAATFGYASERGVAVGAASLAEEDKAKPSIENAAAPEVHFRALEGQLNEYAQATRPQLKIQVDVYGAELEAAFRVVEPDEYTHSLQCTALDMGPQKTLHQRWECTPGTSGGCGSLRPILEGSYRLEVEAHSKHGSTVKHFAWSYEKKLLQMHLENKEEWGRDDALYVQLEGREDTVWNRLELFAGEGGLHRAVRTACPQSLPTKPESQCFKVSLSDLPNLPHGPYKLNLIVKFVDKAGNRRSHTRSFNIRINRQLWSFSWLPPRPWASVAVTGEGLLLAITRWQERTGMPLESFLVALNAAGEEAWRTKLPHAAIGLWLGNHRGLDVVLTNCFDYRHWNPKGFFAFNAKTGEALSEACIDAQSDAFISAILQGGPDKDLVMLRRFSKGDDNTLELCRFVRPHASSPWGFRCGEPKVLPKTEGMGSVVRTPEGARVFVGSLKHHWCALEWKDKKKGRENETWTQGCVEQGPDATGLGLTELWIRLGSKHLWAFYQRENGGSDSSELQSFELDAGSKAGANVFPDNVSRWSRLWLVDVNDELIVPTKLDESVNLQRFSATGKLLSERGMPLGLSDGLLMEGGMLVLLDKEANVLCLKPDFGDCWAGKEGVLTRLSNFQVVRKYREKLKELLHFDEWKEHFGMEKKSADYGGFLGVLPLSPTRSVVVFSWYTSTSGKQTTGFLVDSPGLKKDAR